MPKSVPDPAAGSRTRQDARLLDAPASSCLATDSQPPAIRRRVAVIGTGSWGKELVRTFAELGALRAVCDSDPDRLAAMPNGTVKHYGRMEDCLADPEISAVAIATPVVSHSELARLALLSGKDVLVEKPLALNARDGRALVVLAAASDRILMVGNALRYDPAICRLKDMVDGGELGSVEYICSARMSVDPQRAEESIVWSLAPYEVSVILGLLGEMPVAVSCQGGDYVGRGVSDVTISQYAFAGGVRAQVFVSRLRPFREKRLVVVGSERIAVYDETAPDRLSTYPRRDVPGYLPTTAEAPVEPVPVDTEEPMKAECQAFVRSLETRQPTVTDGRVEVRELEVSDACVRSLSHDGMRTVIRPPAHIRFHRTVPARFRNKHEQPASAGSITAPA